MGIRIRAAMRVVQPKTEKYNNKTETAFKYAIFIRKGFPSDQIYVFSMYTLEIVFHTNGLVGW